MGNPIIVSNGEGEDWTTGLVSVQDVIEIVGLKILDVLFFVFFGRPGLSRLRFQHVKSYDWVVYDDTLKS